jgi:hypothetical protein
MELIDAIPVEVTHQSIVQCQELNLARFTLERSDKLRFQLDFEVHRRCFKQGSGRKR